MTTASYPFSQTHEANITFLKIATCYTYVCWHVSSSPTQYQSPLARIYFSKLQMCLGYYTRILYVIQPVALRLLFAPFRVGSSDFALALSVWSHLAQAGGMGQPTTSAGTDSISRKEAVFASSSGTKPRKAVTCIREADNSNLRWDNDYSGWIAVVSLSLQANVRIHYFDWSTTAAFQFRCWERRKVKEWCNYKWNWMSVGGALLLQSN